jgi:predicted Zn-dependent peptidase
MPWVQSYVLTTLDDGMRVISEPLGSVRSVAIGLWIHAGSRDEDEDRAGVSHFLEHLLFKGSQRYSALEIAEIFDVFGGELNAATSREYTLVYARVLDTHLEEALDVMTDMVFVPTLEDLDSEREVVLEEIAMVEDTPQDLVFDLIAEAIFGGHPLGRAVIGRAEVLSTISRRRLAAYHRSRYTAENTVVSAAGNVDHETLVELAARLAAKRGAPPARRGAARRPLVNVPPPSLRFVRKDTEQYHVCVGAPGIARTDPRRFVAAVLDGLLGGSASSRLFQEIREKRGLAYSVYTFSSQYADAGQIGVYVGTREENVEECLALVARELAAVAAGDLVEAEVWRAKEHLKGRVMLSMESTASRMSRLGKSIVTGSEILSLDRLLAEIEAVHAEQVAELASVLFAPERLSVAGIGPNEAVFRRGVERVAPGLVAAAAA